MTESKRILITGVNGFIGSRVAKAMLEDGFVVDGLSLDTKCRVPGLSQYHSIAIEDETSVSRVIEEGNYYCVIHLAAIVHKKSNEMTQKAYDRVNHRASANIFRTAAKSGVKRILFASTVEVFGNTPENFLDENSPTNPTTFYGKSKLAAEHALQDIAEQYDVECAILRFAPVYAPDFRMNVDKRIYLKTGKLAYYFKDGSYTFHFVSVDNVIEAFHALMRAEKIGGIYVLADKSPFSAREIIDLEKQYNNLKVVIRVPYAPAYAGIYIVDKFTKMMEPKDIFLSLYNFNKIFKCTEYDTSRIRALCDMSHDLRGTLYPQEDNSQ